MRFMHIVFVESVIHKNYNNYRSMVRINTKAMNLLAEARAIHLAMRHGALTYEQAKLRVQPILGRVNTMAGLIAKRHNIKPKYIKFQALGRVL